MFPVKSLIDAGLKPVIESNYVYADSSGGRTTTPEGFTYLWLLEKFVTRKNDQTGGLWGSQERVSRREALWMATNWASRYYGDQDTLGSIEPGKLADLVILGGDYMGVPEEEISELPVLKTIVGGQVMYER